MRRLTAIIIPLLLLGFVTAQVVGQPSPRVTLEFSEEDPDSLSEDEAFDDDDSFSEFGKRRESSQSRQEHGRSGNLVRFGEDIIIPAGERIRGDVVALGGDVTVRGSVDGDVASVGGDVIVEDGGEVRGEAMSMGGEVIERGSGSVGGSSVSVPRGPPLAMSFPSLYWQKNVGDVIGNFLLIAFFLLLAWGLVKLVPERTEVAAETVRRQPGSSFLWGLLGVIGLVPSIVAVALVAAILCITIIGIPIAILLLLGYFLALLLLTFAAFLVGAAVIGRWLVKRFRPEHGEPTLMRSLVVGVLALSVAEVVGDLLQASWVLGPFLSGFGGFLEFIGSAVEIIAFIFGLGAVLASRGGMPGGSFRSSSPPAAGSPPSPPAPSPPPAAAPLAPPEVSNPEGEASSP